MSNRNDYTTGPAALVGFVLAALFFAGLFLFALAAFASFVLTILALCAWFQPLRLGRLTLEPQAARAFVLRGIAGTFLIPSFAVFSSILFDFTIEPEAWPYLFLGGYVAGSIGVAILMADEEEEPPHPAQPPLPPPPPVAPPVREPQPAARRFDFADWDDDEVR